MLFERERERQLVQETIKLRDIEGDLLLATFLAYPEPLLLSYNSSCCLVIVFCLFKLSPKFEGKKKTSFYFIYPHFQPTFQQSHSVILIHIHSSRSTIAVKPKRPNAIYTITLKSKRLNTAQSTWPHRVIFIPPPPCHCSHIFIVHLHQVKINGWVRKKGGTGRGQRLFMCCHRSSSKKKNNN